MIMDLKKLKIEKFKNIMVVNFPNEIETRIKSTDKDVEVILYYIDQLSDVQKFVELCGATTLLPENRTIMVFKKGRKDGINRDSLITPFRKNTYPGFKLRAPMLCSISDTLSAFVLSKEILFI